MKFSGCLYKPVVYLEVFGASTLVYFYGEWTYGVLQVINPVATESQALLGLN